jgi:hypothetical protein
MPDFLHILTVEPPLKNLSPADRARIEHAGIRYPESGDDEHTWRTLSEVMQALASLKPPLTSRVLTRGTASFLDIATLSLESGTVVSASMALSTDAGRAWEDPVPFAPDVEIALDVLADTLIDEVAKSAFHDDDGEADGTTIVLPFEFRDVRGMTDALALVAGHLAGESVRLVTEVDGQFFSALLDRRHGVKLRPLWLFHPDETLRRWVRRQFPMPLLGGAPQAPPRRLALSAPTAPSSPLTTGSLRSRRSALSERLHPTVRTSFQGMTSTTWTDAPLDESLFAELAAAVQAPENEGPAFEALRTDLYEAVAKFTTVPATQLLLERLGHEEEPTRWALYQLLSKRPAEDACRAVARAWRSESPDLRRQVGQLLWRQERALELCVRELAAEWASDPVWAKETVRLLEDECVKIPREWLDGAPAEASRMLASLLVDG